MAIGPALANASASDRPASDFYATPNEVTEALCRELRLKLQGETIWEPACGKGHMSKVLEQYAGKVLSTDLFATGYGTDGVDFTKAEIPAGGASWIITNPPFKESEKFIAVAGKMWKAEMIDGFALLLKSQYWHSSRRLALFKEFPPSCIMPLTWRPDFHFGAKGGSPTMEVLWTVWDLNDPYAYTGTRYVPLAKPK